VAIPVMFSNAPAGSLYSLWDVAEAIPVERVGPPTPPLEGQVIDLRRSKGVINFGSIGGNATTNFNTEK
jgi:hypothetical protein